MFYCIEMYTKRKTYNSVTTLVRVCSFGIFALAVDLTKQLLRDKLQCLSRSLYLSLLFFFQNKTFLHVHGDITIVGAKIGLKLTYVWGYFSYVYI